MTATLIGYARCSTDKQDLTAQRQALSELGVVPDRIYMDKAANYLRRQGRLPDPNLLRYVSPLGWYHISLTGDYNWQSGAAERMNARPLNLYAARIRA